MKYTMQELLKIAEELKEAANISNDELGEWWNTLASLVPRVDDCASEEFRAVYINELLSEHKRLKEEFTVQEITRNQAVTYQRLIHQSEL